ncbi:MAG: protein kinase [Deltaproteobacteria bacterium]|nr:MAG: protein kinase [Deltaproteobacteria bacterium]
MAEGEEAFRRLWESWQSEFFDEGVSLERRRQAFTLLLRLAEGGFLLPEQKERMTQCIEALGEIFGEVFTRHDPASLGTLLREASSVTVSRIEPSGNRETEFPFPPGERRLGKRSVQPPAEGGSVFEASTFRLHSAGAPIPRLGEERYTIQAIIGQGGMGEIVKAFDHDMGRFVAIKRPFRGEEGKIDENVRIALLWEARLTGQLEHPNIVPVHEVVSNDREIYYTMRFVEGRSLQEIIEEIKRGADATRHFTPFRLVQIIAQVCQAIHFAHESGVIHRDLKPANIMVGKYGEVLVMDWGLARLIGSRRRTLSRLGACVERFRESRSIRETVEGTIKGTPAYLSPEQAFGEIERLDRRTDVFLLGATLYETLTGCPPYEGRTFTELLAAARMGRIVPPSERAPERKIHPILEEIVLKATAADPEARYQSAQEMFEEIQAFLDGSREKRFRRMQAAKLCEEAERLKVTCRRISEELQHAGEEIDAQNDAVRPWEPIEKKRSLWAAEDRARKLEEALARTLSDLEAKYQAALGFDPSFPAAREGLADLHWEQFRHAEAARDPMDAVYHRGRVEQFHDGKYARLLAGDGSLAVATHPPGARVFLHPYRECDRILVPGEACDLGTTPLPPRSLPRGSYLLSVKGQGFRDVAYPISIRRNDVWKLEVRLYREADIGEGFVYIPGGSFLAGGDGNAYESLPPLNLDLPSFFIAEFPVTFEEYLEFLDDLEGRSPEEAVLRIPRNRSTGPLCRKDARGRWVPIYEILFEGDIRRRYPPGEGHEWRLPVIGVSWYDAMAYIAWRSEKEGVSYRLPTEEEWEKAARGTDGRFFPWGDHFDATFCKMLHSRPERAQPEPAGVFEKDRSPYGVRDMAGGVRDWTSSVYERRRRATRTFQPGESVEEQVSCVFRGGSWNSSIRSTRCANRDALSPAARSTTVGFRLVKDPG